MTQTVIDRGITYAGCETFAGGLDLGLVQAGLKLVRRLELPGGFGIHSCEANRHLLGYEWDSHVSADMQWPAKKVDVVAACPPCSGFSLMSASAFRGVNSKINSCMWALVGYAARCNPEIVIMESVQQAFTQGRPLMQQLRNHMEERTGDRYELVHVLHNGICIGGAAVRRRYFMVLTKVPFGVERLEIPAMPTVDDVISDLQDQPVQGEPGAYVAPAATAWQERLRSEEGVVDGHVVRYTPNVQRALDLLDGTEWGWGENMSMVTRRYYEQHGRLPASWGHLTEKALRTDFAFGFHQLSRWHPDRHARVITGGAMDLVLHPWLPRPLSMRECMRVMGFPDDWRAETLLDDSGVSMLWGKGVTVQSGRWIGTWAAAALEGQPGIDQGEVVGDRERVIQHTHAHRHRYDRVLAITP